MKKLRAIWELMRLEHGIMLFIAILIGSLISQKTLYDNINLPLISVILTFFTALFLEASTFALRYITKNSALLVLYIVPVRHYLCFFCKYDLFCNRPGYSLTFSVV